MHRCRCKRKLRYTGRLTYRRGSLCWEPARQMLDTYSSDRRKCPSSRDGRVLESSAATTLPSSRSADQSRLTSSSKVGVESLSSYLPHSRRPRVQFVLRRVATRRAADGAGKDCIGRLHQSIDDDDNNDNDDDNDHSLFSFSGPLGTGQCHAMLQPDNCCQSASEACR